MLLPLHPSLLGLGQPLPDHLITIIAPILARTKRLPKPVQMPWLAWPAGIMNSPIWHDSPPHHGEVQEMVGLITMEIPAPLLALDLDEAARTLSPYPVPPTERRRFLPLLHAQNLIDTPARPRHTQP